MIFGTSWKSLRRTLLLNLLFVCQHKQTTVLWIFIFFVDFQKKIYHQKFSLELASESRLSMLQFRGLFEHLNPNSRNRKTDSTSTVTSTKKKKKRISLDSLASLRKKADIIKSGSYERDTFVPPKGKGEKL